MALLWTLLIAFLVAGQVNADEDTDTDDEETDWETACLQPAIRGNCRASIRRYYYNPTRDLCQEFLYGGCGGNENNFDTKAQCEAKCRQGRTPNRYPPPGIRYNTLQKPSGYGYNNQYRYDYGALPEYRQICSQTITRGPCKANFRRWAFDGRRCVNFVYGGCKGNDNNFASEEECKSMCSSTRTSYGVPRGPYPLTPNPYSNTRPPVVPGNPICSKPIIVGPCRAAITRWAFDGTQCVQFSYGGCEGNENSFSSELECRRICGSAPAPRADCPLIKPAPPPAGCQNLPITKPDGCPGVKVYCTGGVCAAQPCTALCEYCINDPVPCANEPCLGYVCNVDETCASLLPATPPAPVSRCTVMLCPVNTRCTESASGAVCVPIDQSPPVPVSTCDLPPDSGPCRAFIPRYFFNRTAGQCQGFTFGGCQGNANNFQTKQRCESFCAIPTPLLCGGKRCGTCETCVSQQVQCIRAPCPPIYSCQRDDQCVSDLCSSVRCQTGRTCDLYDGSAACIFRPADPKCLQPGDSGIACPTGVPRAQYYYNPLTGQCEPLEYNGCAGNENRFETLQDCAASCSV